MRILFLCGSLEPGKDGVGDYTRMLAEAAKELGQEVAVCSLTDPYCPVLEVMGGKPGAVVEVSCLRLPLTLDWQSKERELTSWLGAWRPSMISLQYVPYSFNSRGLPFGLVGWLKSTFTSEVHWNVMFHETWIGITRRSSWKHRLVGALQKRIAQNLVERLRPVVCYTSNSLYVTILGDAGIRAVRLPICSSIRVTTSAMKWMQAKLAESGIFAENRAQWWIAGTFGSCHPDVPLKMQVQNVTNDAIRMGRKPVFFGIGGGSGSGAAWEARVRACHPDAIIRHFGRQTDVCVSAFLLSLDYGLPNCSCEFLGKSSSAAAMWAHGVPLDASYHVELPEYKGRWEIISDQDLFMTPLQIADRLIVDYESV